MMKVQKRNGAKENVSFDKIQNRILSSRYLVVFIEFICRAELCHINHKFGIIINARMFTC